MTLAYEEIRRRCLKVDESQKPLYARVVTHAISTWLIWRFQNLSVTPNTLTLASLLIALAAVPFLATMSPWSVFAGVLLIEIYYIFDAIDGQWARLKNQKSLTGAFFDYLINYAIQPPLVFAIGWGVYRRTLDPVYFLLGFLGAFSTLWVILIWNLRASILLPQALAQKAGFPKPDRVPSAKPLSSTHLVFSWLHRSLVFPWFMHVLTFCGLTAFLNEVLLSKPTVTGEIFSVFLYYYGVGGPAIAITLTTYWILTRKLDQAPELHSQA